MSEKLKPNFTAVPNVILDEAMRTLQPGAVKLVFAICRYTYGWRKPEGERISLKQLQEITGMSRWSVVRSLKQLGRLVSIKPGNATQASEYRLNIEISDADLGAISDQSQNVPSHLGSHLGVTFQRKSKEGRKSGAKAPQASPSRRGRRFTRGARIPPELQATVSRVVAKINELAGTHYRDDKPGALCNLIARLNDGRTEAECLAVVEGRHAAWAGDDKMLEYFRPSTLFAETHFEDYLQAAQRQNFNAEDPDYRKRTFINA